MEVCKVLGTHVVCLAWDGSTSPPLDGRGHRAQRHHVAHMACLRSHCEDGDVAVVAVVAVSAVSDGAVHPGFAPGCSGGACGAPS